MLNIGCAASDLTQGVHEHDDDAVGIASVVLQQLWVTKLTRQRNHIMFVDTSSTVQVPVPHPTAPWALPAPLAPRHSTLQSCQAPHPSST